jgi:pantoate--beta-alanine ligase
MGLEILRTVRDIRRVMDESRPGSTIGLVPTMGALHEGHLELFRAARHECQLVVASLFVNPSQFNDATDLAAYPRDEQRDTRMASEAGVDYLFAPTAQEMYPAGHATWVEMEGPARGLEGEFRPGHFRGVATVCLKLFMIVRPHRAYFGQKDAQQVAVVKRMARDLNLDLEIRVVPTVREADGLALASRNVNLSPVERTRALAIVRALEAGLAAHRAGRDPITAARAALRNLEPEYVAVAELEGHPTLAIAARVGRTRLIDNVPLDAESVREGADLESAKGERR